MAIYIRHVCIGVCWCVRKAHVDSQQDDKCLMCVSMAMLHVKCRPRLKPATGGPPSGTSDVAPVMAPTMVGELPFLLLLTSGAHVRL